MRRTGDLSDYDLTGYRDCLCCECFEISIGDPLCGECLEAGCDVDGGPCEVDRFFEEETI